MGKPLQRLRSVRRLRVGKEELVIVQEVGKTKDPKLDEQARKDRRQDNQQMKISHKQHRKRKKHGRQ